MTEVEIQIEIPKGGTVKYEYDHINHKLICDRFLHVPFTYPFNYGYIPNTLSQDGDPLDGVILCEPSLFPTTCIKCKIIGALKTEDEKGEDDKIILIPSNSVDPNSKNIHELSDIDDCLLKKIEYFFEHYKDLEKDKWIRLDKFVNSTEAIKIYKECQERYKNIIK